MILRVRPTISSALLLSSLLLFSGCSRSTPSSLSTTKQNDQITHRTLNGALLDVVKGLADGHGFTACDRSQQNAKLELAADLDHLAPKLQAMATLDDDNMPVIKVGPTILLDDRESAEKSYRESLTAVGDGWVEDPFNWDELFALHRELKGHPENPDWTKLNRLTRGWLLDDEERIKEEDSKAIGRKEVMAIARALPLLDACMAVESCVDVDLENDVVATLSGDDYFLKTWSTLKHPQEGSAAPRFLVMGLRGWARDLNAMFVANPSRGAARRVSGDTIEIWLDPGPFEKSEEPLRQVIEQYWRSAKLSVKVRWARQAEHPEAYVFRLEDQIEARPYVIYQDKTITLHPLNRLASVAHEIGHVLGFPDYYYTVWDPAKCQYRIQYNVLDLMSESASGVVTAEEWRILDMLYPLQKSQ